MTFPNQPELNSEREELPHLIEDPEAADEYLTAEEAETYLAVSGSDFQALLKRAGVGRYYQPGAQDQFVYARADLERMKSLKTP